MKPFFTDTMLVTMTMEEAGALRAAVSQTMRTWDDKDGNGKLIFPEMFTKYKKLYDDLTKLMEHMPF